MRKIDELEGIRFTEKFKGRQQNEPSVATWRQDQLDDKLNREAAAKILAPTAPDVTEAPEPKTVASVPVWTGKSLIVGDFTQNAVQYHDDYEGRLANDRSIITPGFPWFRRRLERASLSLEKARTIGEYWLVLHLVSPDFKRAYHFDLKDCQIPENSLVEAGVYEMSVERTNTNDTRDFARQVTLPVHVRIEGERCDLSKLTPLSDDELQAAREALESPVVPETVTPRYRRTAREAGDPTSRLGLVVGACTEDIRLPNRFAWHAFNVLCPVVIGSVVTNIDSIFKDDFLTLLIFDPFGNTVLQTRLSGAHRVMAAKFDEIRLIPQNYLVIWKASGALSGRGSYSNSHTGLFQSGLPARPILDSLLREMDATEPIRVGLPQFTFAAD